MGEAVLKNRALTNTMCDTYASCPVVEDGEWIGRFLARRAIEGSIILIHMPERGHREHCMVGLQILLNGLRERNLRAVSIGQLAKLASPKFDIDAPTFDYDVLQLMCRS